MTAEELNEAGREALSEEDYERAVELFQKCTEQSPDWSTPHYNLGLSHKNLHNWQACSDANLRAHELDPADEATQWNLAISSVALSDWERAGLAFRAIGMTLPESPPPWDLKLGLIPIRVNPKDQPEVVWCHRLDPVRAQITNVPLPECQRRFGDIVLNDGAPNGYRQLKGREVPVFDELELLEVSPFATFEVLCSSESNVAQGLEALLQEHQIEVENWAESVRFLCRACSEGRPHEHHDHELEPVSGEMIRLGLAARSEEEVKRVLDLWKAGVVESVRRVL